MSRHPMRALREERGLTQSALADASGLSRQSVGAIESARAVPGVDVALRIARALGASVEALFGDATPDPAVVAEAWRGPRADRVALAHVGGRWVSYPLRERLAQERADGLATAGARRRATVEPLGPLADAAETLVVMGCAAALGVLAARVPARGARVLWVPCSSSVALESLAKQQTHLAGVHLVDGRTGEQNVPDVRRHTISEPVVLVTLARWEAGLVIAAGAATRIEGARDLARPGLRVVTREPGSGARRLLDRALREAGRAPARGVMLEARGHMEVAHAVSLGAADAGIATRDAAIAYALRFVPLAEERYDLVVPRALLSDARVERFFDVMTAAGSRRELAAMGYDVSGCGARVAELGAA